MNVQELSVSDISVFYHTVSNLTSQQLRGIIERKLRHLVLPRTPIDFDARYDARIPATLSVTDRPIEVNTETIRTSLDAETRDRYQKLVTRFSEGTLTFLHRSFEFGAVDDLEFERRQIESYPGLWRLKFNALTPVKWATLGYESHAECPPVVCDAIQTLISKWSRETKIGERQYLRRAWVPHAVSLRVLTLARFYTWLDDPDEEFARLVRQSLYKNALFLRNHVEYDVGGNHLIENAAALLVAGLFFETDQKDWCSTAINVFNHAAQAQFLADGGHFERSPMYHKLVLQRYLTAMDLLTKARGTPPAEIEQTAIDGVDFLASLAAPDRRIPLLNDAAFDEFLSLTACLAYATSIGVEPTGETPQQSMEASGYYWLGDDSDRLLVDGGEVGPAHLPGHSHNDMLSILLWIDGNQILTDTGAYNYLPDETRTYVRGVGAHNSVQVGDHDPIAVGGQYLMGRRCRPASRVHLKDGSKYYTGWYKKRRLSGLVYSHRRDIVAGDDWWLVSDIIDGTTDTPIRSRLHFHPDAVLDSKEEGYQFRRTDGSDSGGRLRPFGVDSITEKTTPYFPRFGEEVTRSALQLTRDSTSGLGGFVITTGAKPTVTSHADDDITLTMGSRCHEIRFPTYNTAPTHAN